jgi:hypothetical protein
MTVPGQAAFVQQLRTRVCVVERVSKTFKHGQWRAELPYRTP